MADYMDVKGLHGYKMTFSEKQKWESAQKQIISDCEYLQILPQFKETIEKKMNSTDSCFHEAGYCENRGYYYISIGDHGEATLKCISKNVDDIRWYFLEEILSYVGREMELKIRRTEERNWRYTRDFKDGKLSPVENENWIYNTIHDTRKYWFEYAIDSLYEIFGAQRLQPYVNEKIDSMNKWFDQSHWDFNWEKMCFVEISDSQEHD